ncbi:hypothetical protein HNS78_001391 [Salmonella enterica]|nr:hypothetical protein [Salmonella enterica]EHA3135955.1 hypothetical protein [Salmonella enterica subsp. enterica serovar Orion]EHD3257551.1 hypothetical protein [Salmonella enterica]
MTVKRRIDVVFPAPAGINRMEIKALADGECVPRASGDKPDQIKKTGWTWGCSPRQRG